MSEHYMPFGSSSGDRPVTSADFARYFGAFIGDGVLVNPSTNLQVLENTAMTVTLKLGMAFVNSGYFYYNDAEKTLTIDTADGELNRKDNIVIRWDINTRTISALVIKGTPASSATAPALVRTNEQYDLKVAEISIPAGAILIPQASITDTRANSSVCGYSTGVLQQIDATTLFAQFTDAFNTWFDEMKDQLSEDAAGNLQNQIDDLAGTGRTTETVKGNADTIASHVSDPVAHMTQAQKDTLNSALQSATLGGAAVTKNGTQLQFPAYPTSLPADGGNASSLAGFLPSADYQPAGSYIPVIHYYSPLEIGQYLDFHNIGSPSDFDARMQVVNGGLQATNATESDIVLRNIIILPYKTSTIPTGLADGTLVFKKDVDAP